MQHQTATKSVDEVVAGIQALDLEPIKFKASHPQGDKRWPREYAEYLATEYKKFLTLLVKYPDETIAPTNEVDEFWHLHILDTRKYAADCESVFGYFIHHFPYFGMRSEEDAQDLETAGNKWSELYAREFGQSAKAGGKGEPAYCYASVDKSAKPAYCYAASKPSYCYASVDGKTQVQAAYCYASLDTAGKPAYCYAVVKAEDAAYCYASIDKSAKPAYCYAALKPGNAAYCYASIDKSGKPAYYYAAVTAEQKAPAYCYASVTVMSKPAYCYASAEKH
jgi:hypothetical protein